MTLVLIALMLGVMLVLHVVTFVALYRVIVATGDTVIAARKIVTDVQSVTGRVARSSTRTEGPG